jgi:hypothetical protein
MARTQTVAEPLQSPFLLEFLSSLGTSDASFADAGSFCTQIGLARKHVPALLAAGLFDNESLERTVRALVVEIEKDSGVKRPAFERHLAVVAESDAPGVSDAFGSVRIYEREAAYALGIVVGILLGGAR